MIQRASINLTAVLALLLAMPVLVVPASLFVPGSGDIWRHLWDTVLGLYAFNSLWLMISVACVSLFLGLPPAWLVTMYRFPGHRWVDLMLILPLSIPAYILGYVYGDWLQNLTSLPAAVRSTTGVVCALSLALYPYIYLSCRATFTDQPNCMLETARTLGCGRVRTFFPGSAAVGPTCHRSGPGIGDDGDTVRLWNGSLFRVAGIHHRHLPDLVWYG